MVTGFRRSLAGSAVLLLATAVPTLAQVQVTTLDELRRELRGGDLVSIVQTTGTSVEGELLRVGEADLDVKAQHGLKVTVPFDVIRSLDRRRDTLTNGVLIGAAVGAAPFAGLFIYGMAVDMNEIDEWAPVYLALGGIGAGIGALVGLGVDSAISKPRLRFDAVPMISRSRKGMQFAVSF